MRNKNISFLAKFALASSVFLLSLQASAFTILGAGADGEDSGNPAYPPNTGYNFFAPNVNFTILSGTTVGVTGPVSIDNTLNFVNDNIFFAGSAIVQGTIGATKAIGSINIDGNNATTVTFQGSLLNATPLNFENNGLVVLDPLVNLTGNVDNLTASPAGIIAFLGDSTISGNIGTTTPLYALSGQIPGVGPQVVTLSGNNINVNIIQAGSLTGTTQFNLEDGTIVTGNFETIINNKNLIVLKQTQINGNIGETGLAFQTVTVDNAKNATVNGDIFATNTIIGTNSSLSIGDKHSIFGPVDSNGVAPLGKLNFLGNSFISMPIGAVNPLAEVNITGPAGSIVTLGTDIISDDVNVNGGGTLSVLENDIFGFNVDTNLTISNQSNVLVQPSAIINIANDFTLNAGTTLQLDMGGNQFLLGGVIANNQAILDPAATIEILNPGFVPFHSETSIAIISRT